MGNIGDSLTEGSIPAVGTAGTTYASELTAFLTEVQARLEAPVPRDSLAPGDLDLDGDYLQNAGYVGLSQLGLAPTTPNNTIQSFDGELYWVSAGGVVQITDTGGLNVGAFGGITGDYDGSPEQFRFVDADATYYAYDDFGAGAWARLWARSFDVAAGATGAVRARIAYGGAGSFTLTLPATRPGAGTTKFVQIDENGTLASSNVTTEAVTVASLKFTSNMVLLLPAASFHEEGNTQAHSLGDTGYILGATTQRLFGAIPLHVGDRIKSVVAYMQKNTDTDQTITVRLVSLNSAGTRTVIASDANGTNAPGDITPGPTGLTTTLATTVGYYVEIDTDDATPSTADYLRMVEVTYDRPV